MDHMDHGLLFSLEELVYELRAGTPMPTHVAVYHSLYVSLKAALKTDDPYLVTRDGLHLPIQSLGLESQRIAEVDISSEARL